jgi:hypothetical protein
MSTVLDLEVERLDGAANKSYIRHSTSDGTSSSTAHQASQHQQKFVPANQNGKAKKNKSRHYKRKP